MRAGEFREKYLALGETLYRIAFFMLESEADAEDAVQDLYLKLWNSRDALDSVRSPKAYCITVLRNMCLDRIRKAPAVQAAEMQDDIPAEGGADSAMIDRERFSGIMKAVESLPAGEKEVLKMRVFEDMSYSEMSERTGRSGLTLRVMLSNARRKIRKAI